MARRTVPGTRAAVVSLRRREPTPREAGLPRLLPSVRSILVGLVLVAAAAGLYLLARDTSMFAVRSIEVAGAPPALAARIRAAVGSELGVSLLRLDGPAIVRSVSALPEVGSVSYDRAFPHTLRVLVRPEVPVAVLRQGASAWLVSGDGRVIRKLAQPRASALPRIWVKHDVAVSAGATLESGPAVAASTLAAVRRAGFPARVRYVRSSAAELTLVLRSGEQIRLGDASDLALKLAIARRILVLEGVGPGYVDVSVPARPVSSDNPQLGG